MRRTVMKLSEEEQERKGDEVQREEDKNKTTRGLNEGIS